MSKKFKFSGHESFNCRHIWLKKGFDFVESGNSFGNPKAVVKLGVGKNMVASINYWLLAFGIINKENETSKFGKFIFGDNGVDPFLENPATIWLLHYSLIKTDYASIYNLFFNDFKNEILEYNYQSMLNKLIQKCNSEDYNYNVATLEKDRAVFLRNYLTSSKKEKNTEDEYSGIFISANIIERTDTLGHENFRVIVNDREEIPNEILLFAILDQYSNSTSISFSNLLSKNDSVGNCFLINEDGLYKKLLSIQTRYSNIVFKDDAGIKEIQIKKKIDMWNVLREYYAK